MSNSVVCPLDSRYSQVVKELSVIFCEESYYKNAVKVELEWFYHVSGVKQNNKLIDSVLSQFDKDGMKRLKKIEEKTKHDIKAVEYLTREYLKERKVPERTLNNVHLYLTSQDIVSITYNKLMVEAARILHIQLNVTMLSIKKVAETDAAHNKFPARTHGQRGVFTTFERELNVFRKRVKERSLPIRNRKVKFGGAINDLQSFPQGKEETEELVTSFLEKYGFEFGGDSMTQVDNFRLICEFLTTYNDYCNILIDLCRDMWTYNMIGYFTTPVIPGEIGSSTMSQKVNPIKLEQAEGSLELASSLFTFMINKFPKSRLQRDLTDSIVIRNLGVSLCYYLLALKSIKEWFGKVSLNTDFIKNETEKSYECHAEAVQLLLKKYGVKDAYTLSVEAFRGKSGMDRKQFIETIQNLSVNVTVKRKIVTAICGF